MSAKNKSAYKLNVLLPVIILVLLLDLLFLYYIKYANQGLSLSEFNFSRIGNFLNLLFTVIILLGIIFYSLQKKNKPKPALIISFTIILNIVLILAALSIKIKMPASKIFIFAHPFDDVLTAVLFMLYQFIEFLFLSILWLNIFGGKQLLILRSAINSVIIVVLLFLFAFIYLSTKTESGKLNFTHNRPPGIAVVLGAAVWSGNTPSPSLAARTDKAVELLRKGDVSRVQLTGGNAPGELSEAEVAYNYIKKQNIDTSKISMEKKTKSTSQQVSFIKNNFLNKDSLKNVVIISDSYHLARIKEICKFYNVKTDVVSSNLNFSFENKIYYKLRESIALIIFWFFAL